MKTFNLLVAMLLGLFVVTGCSKSDAPPIGAADGVEVRLAAGSAAPLSRAAFDEGTPVAVYIYQREVAGVMNLETTPYKVATGVTSSTMAERSAIVLTGGDVSDGKLTLKIGYTYDFVMVVNPPSDPSKPSVGAVNSGVMGAIPHGVDLLAGRKEGIAVTEGMTAIEIAFTEFGADEKGNLPHLCSGIGIEANATQALIDKLTNKGSELNFSVAAATFKKVAAEAKFHFSSAPLAVTPNPMGYKSSFRMAANTEPVKITTPEQKVLYDKGILLPYPLLSSNDYNVIDIDFYLGVNGAEALLVAQSVQVPEFKAGYRYKFSVEMDKGEEDDVINLYLTVTKWDETSWDSGMGGDDTAQLRVLVGSWSSVSWQSGMGGDDNDKLLLTVSGWSSATWGCNIGGSNEDGSNSK